MEGPGKLNDQIGSSLPGGTDPHQDVSKHKEERSCWRLGPGEKTTVTMQASPLSKGILAPKTNSSH